MTRILLSAYACEPDKGSEPAVGWGWATALPRLGHDVTVLTRTNNRAAVEHALAILPDATRPRFAYYDLPPWLAWWKRGSRGVHLYYLLWQWGAYRLARRLHRERRFDLVHHVTFVSVHQPSFMGRLGIPFWFGPVSGGDRIPRSLRASFPVAARLRESLRDLANVSMPLDPLMRATFRAASRILVTSEATRALFPARDRPRAEVTLAIALPLPPPARGGGDPSRAVRLPSPRGRGLGGGATPSTSSPSAA